MPYSLFLSTVGYAKLYGAKSIILSGGEVLLHPSWKEMVEVTIKNGLFLDFITNGTLINSKTASFFSNFEKDQFKITPRVNFPVMKYWNILIQKSYSTI